LFHSQNTTIGLQIKPCVLDLTWKRDVPKEKNKAWIVKRMIQLPGHNLIIRQVRVADVQLVTSICELSTFPRLKNVKYSNILN